MCHVFFLSSFIKIQYMTVSENNAIPSCDYEVRHTFLYCRVIYYCYPDFLITPCIRAFENYVQSIVLLWSKKKLQKRDFIANVQLPSSFWRSIPSLDGLGGECWCDGYLRVVCGEKFQLFQGNTVVQGDSNHNAFNSKNRQILQKYFFVYLVEEHPFLRLN